MSRAAMSRSNTAGLTTNTIGCRHWRRSWWGAKSTSSPPTARRHSRRRRPPRLFRSCSRPGSTRSTLGLVSSLHRPGGNVTGTSMLNVEGVPKRLQLLNELGPAATVMALLVNPSNPNAANQSRDLQAAARTLGLQLHILHASSERDFDTVFAKLHELRAGGLVIGADAFFNTRSAQLAALALSHAMPAAYQYREFAAAGGLMSYAGSITGSYRQAGVYTGRILKGEKPADLPVIQSTKFEFVINLNTARVFGLSFPPGLLAIADEGIELAQT